MLRHKVTRKKTQLSQRLCCSQIVMMYEILTVFAIVSTNILNFTVGMEVFG
jgi:hypothetical protein